MPESSRANPPRSFKILSELDEQLDYIQAAPKTQGTVELIVCRPEKNMRKVLKTGMVDTEHGLIGDNWLARQKHKGNAEHINYDTQLNLMNLRVIASIADNKDSWPLAGDQFYVDLDLSTDNLPAGSRLAMGNAIIEITAEPHLGCRKFSQRFGIDATKFVNSKIGKRMNLRGVNARVVKGGEVRQNDIIQKLT